MPAISTGAGENCRSANGKPLKRALHPFGGINMIKSSFDAYGREMDSQFEYLFSELRKTHNQGYLTPIRPICCAAVNPAC